MAWMSRKEEELPEKLKGKTPEQIVEELAKLEKERDEEKAAATKAAEDAKGQLSEFEKMKARLAELEASHREPEPPPQPLNQPADWLTDPDAAFAQRSAPLTAMQLHTGAIAAKLEGRNQIQAMEYGPFIIRKYWNEVEKMVQNQPPQQKIFPETWVNAAVYVKGLHAKELATTENADSPFFSEPVGSSAPPPPTKKDDVLTEQEAAIVKKMKITPERYLARKKNMKVEASF